MIKTLRIAALMIFLFALATPVFAQDAEYRVHPRRMFGYGNGSDVRGNFELTVTGNQDNIRSVTYLLDGKEMSSVESAPFKFNFNTGSYQDGAHALSAIVNTKDGRQVTTPEVHLNFLNANQESQSMQRIFIPLMGGILLVVLIGVAAQVLIMRRGPAQLAPGTPRNYGMKGGTICPRCGRAYAIHFWSLNLAFGCLDRCDYCGKWAFVRSRPRAELDAAVEAEAAAAQASESSLPAVAAEQSEEERLRRMLEESKYNEE